MTHAQFFATEAEAKRYVKEQGRGIIYKNVPRSRTKRDWEIAANAIGLSEKQKKDLPYVVEVNI